MVVQASDDDGSPVQDADGGLAEGAAFLVGGRVRDCSLEWAETLLKRAPRAVYVLHDAAKGGVGRFYEAAGVARRLIWQSFGSFGVEFAWAAQKGPP